MIEITKHAPKPERLAKEAENARVRHLLSKLGAQQLLAFHRALDEIEAGDRATLTMRDSETYGERG